MIINEKRELTIILSDKEVKVFKAALSNVIDACKEGPHKYPFPINVGQVELLKSLLSDIGL